MTPIHILNDAFIVIVALEIIIIIQHWNGSPQVLIN